MTIVLERLGNEFKDKKSRREKGALLKQISAAFSSPPHDSVSPEQEKTGTKDEDHS